MEALFDRLRPIPRSISGEGVRLTHDILAEVVPLTRIEVPSGAQVFDWQIPEEWNVAEAYLVAPDGRRLLEYAKEPLHLVGYSTPFQGRLSRSELEGHLYSLPDQPTAIPYVTSYYAPRWGFCLAHEERLSLPDGEYEVVVDTRLEPGSLTLSECLLPGETEEEVLLTTYTCHPSMANNELSGPLVAAFLYRRLASLPRRRLSYRFVFGPETIGALAYLQLKGAELKERMVAGYVITCTGGPGGLTYKRTLAGDTVTDRAAEHYLAHLPAEPGRPAGVLGFAPTGSDERQYNSPGFRLPVGSLMRSRYGTYPEYHTSLDDKAFLDLPAVQRTLDAYFAICGILDANVRVLNTLPYGEPQLGRRGLYPTATVAAQNVAAADAVFWTLCLADGELDLLSIAERSGLPFEAVRNAADKLAAAGVVERAP